MPPGDPGSHRAGIIAGVGAYLFWGLFPLYWGFLEPATPYEVLAARMVFALAVAGAPRGVAHQWAEVAAVLSNRRQSAILAVAAVLVSVNWGVFIWAVANDMVVDTSLGYFINPLVSVALGVLVLRERLRSLQWVAVAIASAAVLYATVSLGRLPGSPWRWPSASASTAWPRRSPAWTQSRACSSRRCSSPRSPWATWSGSPVVMSSRSASRASGTPCS